MEIEYDLTLEEFGAFARPMQEKKTQASLSRQSLAKAALWIVVLALVLAWTLLSDRKRGIAIMGCLATLSCWG
jgi:hypothetical protein